MIEIAREIFRRRGLLAALVGREIKARYRGSALGFLWSLVQPILLLAVYSFVFGFVFRPRAEGAEPYALFLVTGLFPWIWLSTSILEGATSLVANAGLIRRAVFPAELLPLVPVLANGVHLLLAPPILAAGLVWGRLQGADVGGVGAVALPGILALATVFVSGVALGVAALHAHFKDVRDLVANLLTLAFFLTPILYPLAAVESHALRLVVLANPATPFTLALQQALFAGRLPSAGHWLAMAGVALVAWILGAGLFSRLKDTLVEAV